MEDRHPLSKYLAATLFSLVYTRLQLSVDQRCPRENGFCDPTRHAKSPTRPVDHELNTDPTRPDQLVMMPKVEFLKINIIHVVKFMFKM